MRELPTKTFLNTLGGYRAVAKQLGENPRTVHNWTRWDTFPLAQYQNLHELAAREGVAPPQDSLFPFKGLPDQKDEAEANQ